MHRFLALGATFVVALALSGVAAAWSWPADGEVLHAFELGSDTYAAGQHRGIDVAGAAGSPVRAPAAGTVTFAGSVPTHGRGITILTPDGYSVTLFHLESVGVVKGDAVDEGATVGTMGSSGDAEHNVPTVHLGIRVADRADGYVDPVGLLPARPLPQPASPPAAPAAVPVATPVPAPTAPAPSLQPPPPVAAATSVPAPSPPPVVPVQAAVAPPVAPPVVISPPAVTAPTPEPVRVSTPATAPSAGAAPIGSSAGGEPARDAVGDDVAAPAAHPVHRALTAPTVADHAQVGRTSAGGARAAYAEGDTRPHDSANRGGAPARVPTVEVGLAELSSADRSPLRSIVDGEAGRDGIRPVVRDERALTPVAGSSHSPLRAPSPAGGGHWALGRLADGPGSLPASVEVRGPGAGLGLAELVTALALLALVTARIVTRVARRIGRDGGLRPDEPVRYCR